MLLLFTSTKARVFVRLLVEGSTTRTRLCSPVIPAITPGATSVIPQTVLSAQLVLPTSTTKCQGTIACVLQTSSTKVFVVFVVTLGMRAVFSAPMMTETTAHWLTIALFSLAQAATTPKTTPLSTESVHFVLFQTALSAKPYQLVRSVPQVMTFLTVKLA